MFKRTVFFSTLIFILSACSKQKVVQKRFVGTWKFTKQINNDGSEILKTDIYVFEAGIASNSNLLHVFGSDTLELSYLLNEKGNAVKFFDAKTNEIIENWLIDYQKKDLLVLKTGYAICIFERQ
jgi:hypothetical protein